jgi:hypothetical protein
VPLKWQNKSKAYPELRFSGLLIIRQKVMIDAENPITFAQKFFIAPVTLYHLEIYSFAQNIVSIMLGLKEKSCS